MVSENDFVVKASYQWKQIFECDFSSFNIYFQFFAELSKIQNYTWNISYSSQPVLNSAGYSDTKGVRGFLDILVGQYNKCNRLVLKHKYM